MLRDISCISYSKKNLRVHKEVMMMMIMMMAESANQKLKQPCRA